MKRSTLELWVGLFVALGIAAVVFLSFRVASGQSWGGQSSASYTVSAYFTDIGGLKVKAPVKASGVVVGRVSSIRLDPATYQAEVKLELSQQYPFSSDVSAEILTSGLLGEQYIGITPGGEDANLEQGSVAQYTQSAVVLEELISKFLYSSADQAGTAAPAPQPAQ